MRYVSKPKFVDAIQFDGSNKKEVKEFIGKLYDNSRSYPNVSSSPIYASNYIYKDISGTLCIASKAKFLSTFNEVILPKKNVPKPAAKTKATKKKTLSKVAK